MPSFIQLLTLVCSALLFGSAVAQRPRPTPACLRSDTKDLAKLEQCIKTTVFAIESVTNADGDFTEACDEIKYAEASSQNLDVYFLRVLICGSFGGQGVFYDNSDDAIAELSYARVALRIAEDSSTDPVLRLICPELDLQTLYDFGLPAGNIYNAACGDVYISSPPSYTSSASTASTTSSSSSSDVSISAYDPSSTDSGSSTGTTPASPISPSSYTGPPTPSDSLISSTYPPSTTPPPPYTGDTTSSFSSSTSCTTTSTSIPVHMYRRVNSLNQTYDYWTELLKSAIFALDLIETNDDDTRCDESDIWIDAFNRLGYDGEYVESMLCASAAGNDLFPPSTLIEARASLITAFRGLIYAQANTNDIARQISCDNLSYATLTQAKLNATQIIQLVCFPPNATSSSSSTVSSSAVSTTSSTGSTSSASSTDSSSGISSTSSSSSSSSTGSSSTSSTSSSSSLSSTGSFSSSSTSSSSSASSSSSPTSSTTTSDSTSSTSTSTSSSTGGSTTVSSSSTTSSDSSSSSTSSPFSGSATSPTSSTSSSTTSMPSSDSSSSSSSTGSTQCSYSYSLGAGWRWSCQSTTTTLDTSYTSTGLPTPYSKI